MPQRPNVLFLLSDEHSFRCVSHRLAQDGGEPVLTPTLDALAARGTVFRDAYCQMPLCTPSRICMLTGRQVARSGGWDNCSILPPDVPTIGSAFGDAGYETCLIGKMHLGGNRQFAGFAHRPYGDLTGQTGHQWEPDLAGQTMRQRTAHTGVTAIPESQLQEQVIATETLAFLREHAARSPDKPWLLCASFSRPHFPLTAPRRWFERYWPDGVTEPKVPAGGDAWDHPMSIGMRKGFRAEAIDRDEMMRARAAYFACVSWLDEVLGDLLARMSVAGLLDNTIVVYTTDHGEMAGEHGVWWKNGWYEACTRVPWIISLPRQRGGSDAARAVETPVSLGDLLPTLCGLCGIEPPEGIDGVDLSHAVRGEAAAPDRPVYCDNLIPRWGEGTQFRMARRGRYKVVRFAGAEPLAFDLQADPGEQVNLLGRPDVPGAVRALMETTAASIDFAAAERQRQEDLKLIDRFPAIESPRPGNCYHLADGRVIDADLAIAHPRVICEGTAFSDRRS